MTRLPVVATRATALVRGTRVGLPRGDAAALLKVYCAFLLLIPAPLIVRPIGAAGTPAALWAILLLVWWLFCRVGGMLPVRFSPVQIAMGVFAVALLASYASGMTTGWYAPANIHQSTDDVYDLIPPNTGALRAAMMSAADRGLLALAAWSGVVLVCVDGLRRWGDINRVVAWVVTLATVIAGIGILQFFTGVQIASYFRIPGLSANTGDFGTILERSVLRRVYATATHPIEFGAVLGALFPLALHRALFATRRRAWVAPALIGTAAMMSVSRSAVLVMGVGLIVMFSGWPPLWRRRALVIFPLAAVTLRLLVPGLLGTLLSMWRNLLGDPSTTGRTQDYAAVLSILQDHPILGRGQFTFVPRYYRIMDNQLLVSLVELGVVGLLALLSLIGVAFFCARGAKRRAMSAEHAHLGLALSASVLGMITSYATFDALGFPMSAGVTFLLIGLSGAVWQVAVAEQRDGG